MRLILFALLTSFTLLLFSLGAISDSYGLNIRLSPSDIIAPGPSFLLHFDQSFIDSGLGAYFASQLQGYELPLQYAVGNKFGTGSLRLPANEDSRSVAYLFKRGEIDLREKDWTIDFWYYYPGQDSKERAIFTFVNTTGAGATVRNWLFLTVLPNEDRMRLIFNNAQQKSSLSASLIRDSWNHVAVMKDAVKGYGISVNGVIPNGNGWYTASDPVLVEYDRLYFGIPSFTGYNNFVSSTGGLDEFRVTLGKAIWRETNPGGSFDVPTFPLNVFPSSRAFDYYRTDIGEIALNGSYNWTVPDSVYRFSVFLAGGGGGGAGGAPLITCFGCASSGNTLPGLGGGAGGAGFDILSTNPGTRYELKIGRGGITTGVLGEAGSMTYFDTLYGISGASGNRTSIKLLGDMSEGIYSTGGEGGTIFGSGIISAGGKSNALKNFTGTSSDTTTVRPDMGGKGSNLNVSGLAVGLGSGYNYIGSGGEGGLGDSSLLAGNGSFGGGAGGGAGGTAGGVFPYYFGGSGGNGFAVIQYYLPYYLNGSPVGPIISPPICGNSFREGNEQCDLGTGNNGICPSTCSSSCMNQTCQDLSAPVLIVLPNIHGNNISSLPKLNISLSKEANLSYKINNGSEIFVSLSERRKNFSFVPEILFDGDYGLIVLARGLVGSTGTLELNFTLDRIAPSVTLTNLISQGYAVNYILLAGGLSERVVSCSYQIDISTFNYLNLTNNRQGFSSVIRDISEGTHNLTIQCIDFAGNVNVLRQNITVDISSPRINILFPNAINYDSVSELKYSVSDFNLQSCWYSVNRGINNISVPCNINLSGLNAVIGANYWSVGARDIFGNLNTSEVSFILNVPLPICLESNWQNSLSPTTCPVNGQQTKTWTKIGTCANGISHPTNEIISCTYVPPACTSFTYSDWNSCKPDNTQNRTILSTSPSGCTGGSPDLIQSCVYIATCTESNWQNSLSPTTCPVNGQQTKTWTKIGTCSGGILHPSSEIVNCNYQIPTCTTFTYSDWSSCRPDNTQNRTILSTSPSGCTGGSPILSQTCNYVPQCTEGNWESTLLPSICPQSQQQTKTWTKIGTCSGGILHPSSETVFCTYIPPICASFTYSDWGSCRPDNTQNRTVLSTSPSGCVGGNPILSRSCVYVPLCLESNWQNSLSPTTCPVNGQQTKTWTKIGTCANGILHPTNEIISCTYITPFCISFNYTSWGQCLPSGLQTRGIISGIPNGCYGGIPVLVQTCNYIPFCFPDSTISCDNVAGAIVSGYKDRCNNNGTAYIGINTCQSNKFRLNRNDFLIFESNGKKNLRENNRNLISVSNNVNEEVLNGLLLIRSNFSEKREFLIVKNLTLGYNSTKILTIEKKNLSSNGICFRDVEGIDKLSDILSSCTKLNCPGAIGNYSCSVEGNSFVVSGLRNSGVTEDYLYCGDNFCSSSESCSSCPGDCGICQVIPPNSNSVQGQQVNLAGAGQQLSSLPNTDSSIEVSSQNNNPIDSSSQLSRNSEKPAVIDYEKESVKQEDTGNKQFRLILFFLFMVFLVGGMIVIYYYVNYTKKGKVQLSTSAGVVLLERD